MTYNSNAPSTVGLEWMPTSEGVVLLDTPTAVAPMKIASATTETIDSIAFPHQYSASPSSGYSRHWVDVYDSASSYAPGVAGITELKYVPNEDKARSGTTQEDFATTAPLYSRLSATDDSGPPEASGYVLNSQYWTTGSYLGLQFNTAAIANTYRIAYVRFEVRAKGFDWSWQQPLITLKWYNNATLVGTVGTISPPQDYVFRTYTFGPFYFDFFNEGTWLQPEIAAMDDNTLRNMRLVLDYSCAVSRVTMIVGVMTENRVAVGVGTKVSVPATGVQTNNPVKVKTPLNVDNWAKATGKTYIAVVRRLEDPFSALATLTSQVITLDSATACPQGQGAIYAATTMSNQSGILSAVGAVGTKVAGMIVGVNGAPDTVSVDSQPYWDVEAKPVDSTLAGSQNVTGADGVSTYRRIRMMVGVKTTTPTAPLSIGVRSTATPDLNEAFTGAIPATFTAGSFTAGAAASAATNQLVYTTGITANAYARHRTTNTQSATFMATGKVTFASIASAHYGLVFFDASATFASTGTNPGLTSGYVVRFTANGGVAIYQVGAATAGAETLVATAAFVFTTAQHSYRILRLTQGFIGVKVWATASTEPATWTLVATDTTYAGTTLGVGAQNDAAGGTSRTVSFDDFVLYNYVMVGSLSVANLSDATIATSKGAIGFGPGTLNIYDCAITTDVSAVLANADYTIDLATNSAATNNAWYVLWADSTNSLGYTSAGLVTYGNATQQAAFGQTATAGADLMVTISSVPTAPTALTTTVQTYLFDDNGGAWCDAGSMQYPRVTWTTGSTLGSSFAYYEIHRSYDAGVTWSSAATIATEATKTWDNKEVRRGIAVMYRVRIVRTDGAYSDWRTQTGTVTCQKVSGVMAIVSDADASVIGGWTLLGEVYQYNFRDQTVFMDLHGRDFPMAFKSPYDAGFTWQFRILLYFKDETGNSTSPAAGKGSAAWDRLRAIARSSVPYLALLTPDGEVLCGAIEIVSGDRQEPAQLYEATVLFTKTKAAPTTVAL